MTPDANPWILRTGDMQTVRARLICIPYAGGSAAVFRLWQDRMPAGIEIIPMQFPGRGGRLREPSCKRLTDLLEGMTAAVLPLLDVPFAVFGHSLGALIAYEFILHLRRQGQSQPLRLFASGARSPQIPNLDTPIHHLQADRFVEEMQVRYDGIPAEVLDEPDLLALLLPPLQADLEIYETYDFTRSCTGEPLDCAISTFGGQQDRGITPEQYIPWRELTRRPVSHSVFPGGHFFVQEQLDLVTRKIGADLEADLAPVRDLP